METWMAAAQEAGGTNNWFIYLMFAVAGVLVGGTWSAYQNGAKKLTIVCGILAALALAGAILWLIGGMTK
ncbi:MULTISPECIES: hypothetical protein [unclassified Corynebacterium]|uniref:hypothetical protein n=1 Tax=unclassified Corynebacterium TaxID=2624378 RepID=UPI0029CA217D|nr:MULTISPECIES: hypothetical protein [unclassified Corynebacterium]